MKKNRTLKMFAIGFILFIFVGCETENDKANNSDGKGLVQISGWRYENDTLSFKLSIQYPTPGEKTELEYAIYDNMTLIQNGSANTSVQDAGLNIFFETAMLKFRLPKSSYAGKTILIWADPENKKTNSMYTTETYVDLYKKMEVKIPE